MRHPAAGVASRRQFLDIPRSDRAPRASWQGRWSSPASSPATSRSSREYTPRHLADRILQSKSALEGERNQVTLLCADVQGSMALAQQVDPDAPRC
jgi:class 3 adenylate cyclase